MLSPPVTRARASSTSARPLLSLNTLERRRPPCSTGSSSSDKKMFVLVASRVLDWLHVSNIDNDDIVLPLSSPTKTSPNGTRKRPASVLLVISLFPLSTLAVFLALSSLPISLSWPRTLPDLQQLNYELTTYSSSSLAATLHVVSVISLTAIWKHAWSVPGSVIWNVLAGALWSPLLATPLLTVLTMIGSICASLLSKPLAPFMTRLFPKALQMTRDAIEGTTDVPSGLPGTPSKPSFTIKQRDTSPTWIRLSVLRLVGVVPWSGINIACGICSVPLTDCILGALVGSLPWTAVTCQIGDILQTLSTSSPTSPSTPAPTISDLLLTPPILIKLVFLTILSLAPIALRRYMKPTSTLPEPVRKESLWTIPVSARRRRDIELEEILREKRLDIEDM